MSEDADVLYGIDYAKLGRVVKAQFDASLEAELDLALEVWVVDPSERIKNKLFWRDDMENYKTVKWGEIWPANTVVEYINDVGAFEGNYVLSISNPTENYCEAWNKFGAFKKEHKTAYELRWFYRTSLQHITFAQVRCGSVSTEGKWAWIRWNRSRIDGYAGWQYNSSGTITDVPGGIEGLNVNTWNYIKLIADWENDRYDRLITNNLDIDLSSLSLPLRTVTETINQFRIHVNPSIIAGTTLPYQTYVDDARLYLNVE